MRSSTAMSAPEFGIRRPGSSAISCRGAHPAQVADRGLLAKGCRADLLVFDPEGVANTATDENPAETPTGITDVMVNGAWLMPDGRLTTQRPGAAST